MILASAVLIVSVLLTVLIVYLYNQLVRLRTMVREGWRGIEVQLKRRSNLIPMLIETVNGHLHHERDLLQQVTRWRAQSLRVHDMPDKQVVENDLTACLGRLFTAVENHPELKADRRFQDLLEQLAEIENRIQLARRYYNGTVRNLNMAVETFPGKIVARWFAFETASFFEILQPSERALSEVKM